MVGLRRTLFFSRLWTLSCGVYVSSQLLASQRWLLTKALFAFSLGIATDQHAWSDGATAGSFVSAEPDGVAGGEGTERGTATRIARGQLGTSEVHRASDEAVAARLAALKANGWQRSRFFDWQPSQLGELTEGRSQPNLAEFDRAVKPILVAACFDCHSGDGPEGGIALDKLDPNLLDGRDAEWWNEVQGVLVTGEMPPPDSVELADAERAIVAEWLSEELRRASLARRMTSTGQAMRRLTRYEFNYALQDLLGLPWDFAKDLPPDPKSEEGFQNNGELLQISASQLETYYRLARTALQRVVVAGERPTPLVWRISMELASRHEWPKQAAEIEKRRKEFADRPEELAAELQRLEETFKQTPSRAYFHNQRSGRNAVSTWEYAHARYAILPSEGASGAVPPPSLVVGDDPPEVVAVLPAGQTMNFELGNQLPDEGTLRVRVKACRHPSGGAGDPSLQLYFGWQASNEGRALVRVSELEQVVTAEYGEATFYQWDVPLGEIYPRNSVRTTSPMGTLPSPSEYICLVNTSASNSALQIERVEVLAPLYEQWPPKSHVDLLGPRSVGSRESDGVEREMARRSLERFMTRAWRRGIEPEELERKLALFDALRPQCDRFEDAMVEVMASVLASPHFLYIMRKATAPAAEPNETLPRSEDSQQSVGYTRAEATPRGLDGPELASRLSFFLWCSVPDDELLAVASDGRLLEPEVLRAQARRMVQDPKSKRFTRHFVEQWLNLELLEFLNVDKIRPRVEPLLKEAMQQEPVRVFEEILLHDESVLSFLHADYVMVNERLARHYGLAGVVGNHFRRVPLPLGYRRGGLLTQAGTLMMNSDYPDSHPLKRGKWLLESLLNDPPPPPPPAVPQIYLADPEIAKMTLKERIEQHRDQAACRSCHVKIDPWGIAFENYDALGRWRDTIDGKPVDASSELFNEEVLSGMDGLKVFLLENRQDQFVEAMVHKFATYALGRPLTFADQAELESLTAEVRRGGDRLQSLVIALVESELFRGR